MTDVDVVALPDYVTGTWTIDPAHSDVSFTVRHLMVAKVRGKFTRVEGRIVTAADPLSSSVVATIDLGSVDTSNADRDTHLRSPDFLDAERYSSMTYESSAIRRDGNGFVLDGDLSLHGVTKPVPLEFTVNGFQADTPMGTRAGFTASGELDRYDFGIVFNMPLEPGGFVIGDKVQLQLEIEATLDTEA